MIITKKDNIKVMKLFRISTISALVFLFVFCVISCGDVNEYADTNTDNPSFGSPEGTLHPETLEGAKYVRAHGIKFNAAEGKEVQGFVESVEFTSADSVKVFMSEGTTSGTWIDDSNDKFQPHYYYTYSSTTGRIDIKKRIVDDKGAVSLNTIFMGTAITGTEELITIVHFGDIPSQTYLKKQ